MFEYPGAIVSFDVSHVFLSNFHKKVEALLKQTVKNSIAAFTPLRHVLHTRTYFWLLSGKLGFVYRAEAYLEPCHTSMIQRFANKV